MSTVASASATVSPAHKDDILYESLFWLLLVLFEAFIFLLPLFPNGDGPAHLYLASVFWKLATHSSSFYSHFYALRHLVQPYSLHYYLLILLERVVSADMAEKIIVGMMWATLATGFRTLTRVLGSAAAATSLWIFPLLFSWPLATGFFNFVFATGIFLFSLAYYQKLLSPVRRPRNLILYAVTLVFLVLAHPIPILMLILIQGGDLALQFRDRSHQRQHMSLPSWQTAALGLACIAFIFPILISDRSKVADSILQFRPHLYLLRLMLSGEYLAFFVVHSVAGVLYRLSLIAIVPATIYLILRTGVIRRWREADLHPADRLLLTTLIFLCASVSFPDYMNGSAYFVRRMWYVGWLMIAACGSSAMPHRTARSISTAVSVVAAVLCLAFGFLYLRPLAREQFAIEQAPLPSGQRGLFLPRPDDDVVEHFVWPLSFWDGVRAFPAHNDVLVNTPWQDETIVPVRETGQANLLPSLLPMIDSNLPRYLTDYLYDHPAEAPAVLALADFLFVTDSNSEKPDPMEFARSLLGRFANQWKCNSDGHYAICVRR